MTLQAVPITITEANVFVANFHRHNKPTVGGKFAVGASDGERLVGVAIVGRPIARQLQDGWTLEVTRTCTIEDAPKNTNSFLYGCCWRAAKALGWKKLITYTLQSESGASLRGAGWKVVAEVDAHDGWKRSEPGQVREWQPVYGQAKLRWEAV